MLKLSKDATDGQILFKLILYEIAIVGIVFVPCECGQRLTNGFHEVTDFFEKEMDWYLFPIEIQKLLPIIISNTHIPIVVDCFEVFDGSREQFKRVNRPCSMRIQTNFCV